MKEATLKITNRKIKDIKPNPDNPRVIKDDKFKKLVKSITDFPKMLEIRPVVLDENDVILGGNMRYRAAIDAGLKELPTIQVEDLSEEQKKEFIIKDNVGFGEWDWEMLANSFDEIQLAEWGLDLPGTFADKNEEIDIDSLDGEMLIKLKYNEDDYWKVKEQLSKIASTPEQAVWKLLGNE